MSSCMTTPRLQPRRLPLLLWDRPQKCPCGPARCTWPLWVLGTVMFVLLLQGPWPLGIAGPQSLLAVIVNSPVAFHTATRVTPGTSYSTSSATSGTLSASPLRRSPGSRVSALWGSEYTASSHSTSDVQSPPGLLFAAAGSIGLGLLAGAALRARATLMSAGEGPDVSHSLHEPAEDESTFGRRGFWEETYCKATDEGFSWYTTWEDLAPFWRELVPDQAARVVVPGIGNDRAIVDMYDDGWTNLAAFDYSPAGVACARALLGHRDVTVDVADARALTLYPDGAFDACLEKGTLDAIYISGAKDKALGMQQLQMAVDELARVVRKGGVIVSLTDPAARAVAVAFNATQDGQKVWRQLRDGSVYITEDGFASINVNATILAWERC